MYHSIDFYRLGNQQIFNLLNHFGLSLKPNCDGSVWQLNLKPNPDSFTNRPQLDAFILPNFRITLLCKRFWQDYERKVITESFNGRLYYAIKLRFYDLVTLRRMGHYREVMFRGSVNNKLTSVTWNIVDYLLISRKHIE